MVPQTIVLSLNGQIVGPIKSLEGGGFGGGILDETIGIRGQRRPSAIEIAPFTMEIGAMPTDAVRQWIAASLRGEKVVSGVGSFPIKKGIKKFSAGQERTPKSEPPRLLSPSVICALRAVEGGELLKGHEKLTAGDARSQKKRNGRIEFFSRGK